MSKKKNAKALINVPVERFEALLLTNEKRMLLCGSIYNLVPWIDVKCIEAEDKMILTHIAARLIMNGL